MKSRTILISRVLVLFMVLFSLVGCNEQDFYEKDDLLVGRLRKDAPSPTDDLVPEGNVTDDNTPTGNDGQGGDDTADNGGDDGNAGGDNGSNDPALTQQSDSFIQNSAQQGKVDILWVVDDSGSMGDDQAHLAYNFEAFIESFIQNNVDFKMGITTTDPTSKKVGVMVNDPDALTSTAAANNRDQFVADFQAAIQVGINGSGRERGLNGMRAFNDRYAQDFYRQDAYLIVVYVSDEEDQSDLAVADYVGMAQALKANAAYVKMHSIVHVNETYCADNESGINVSMGNSTESLGCRYMKASDLTGGQHYNIAEDFYNHLTTMGQNIANLVDSFPLAGTPANNDITVLVDGVEVSSGWTYDAQNSAIRFDQNSIPNEGAKIEVVYYVQ